MNYDFLLDGFKIHTSATTLDEKQVNLVSCDHKRILLYKCRASGASTCVRIKALHHALNEKNVRVCIITKFKNIMIQHTLNTYELLHDSILSLVKKCTIPKIFFRTFDSEFNFSNGSSIEVHNYDSDYSGKYYDFIFIDEYPYVGGDQFRELFKRNHESQIIVTYSINEKLTSYDACKDFFDHIRKSYDDKNEWKLIKWRPVGLDFCIGS